MIILVPELEALLRESESAPRLIRRLLASGGSRALDESGALGELVTGKAISPAALTRRLDCPEDADGCWLRADPVDLSPDLSAVWLHAGSRLPVSSKVASELVEVFSQEGLDLDFPVAERGYVRLDRQPECRFVPPWALTGVSMDHVFPEGEDAPYWRRLLNETQVILKQHHQTSADEGVTLPGSLWFWGSGRLPEPSQVSRRVDRIQGQDRILEALGGWLDIDFGAGQAEIPPQPGTLLEWQADHSHSADDNLERLQSEFLVPVWRRLRLDRRLRVVELASLKQVWQFSTLDAWRWWQ